MRKVVSHTPIERVEYIAYAGRPAEVYLHENITSEMMGDGEDAYTEYSADEVFLRTRLPKEEVEARFDELWVRAETEARPLQQRVDELENLLGLVIDEVLGVDK